MGYSTEEWERKTGSTVRSSEPLLGKNALSYLQVLSAASQDRQPDAQKQDAETEWRRTQDQRASALTTNRALIQLIKDLERFGIYEREDFIEEGGRSEYDDNDDDERFNPLGDPNDWATWSRDVGRTLGRFQRWCDEDQALWGQWMMYFHSESQRLTEIRRNSQDEFDDLDSNFNFPLTASFEERIAYIDDGTTNPLLYRQVKDSTAGAGDAAKFVKLDAAGLLNILFYPLAILSTGARPMLSDWDNLGAIRIRNTGVAEVQNAEPSPAAEGTIWVDLDADPVFIEQGAIKTITSADSPYTITATDCFIKADASSGAITVFLPAVAGFDERAFYIKKIDATNNVTVDGDGAELIDGATTQVISTQYDAIKVVGDGSEWSIF